MGETRVKLNQITFEQIMNMEKQERVHFANSLGGFKSVGLIGTKNTNNQTNLAIVDSILHIGSNPPLFGIVFRPGAVERHPAAGTTGFGRHLHPDLDFRLERVPVCSDAHVVG